MDAAVTAVAAKEDRRRGPRKTDISSEGDRSRGQERLGTPSLPLRATGTAAKKHPPPPPPPSKIIVAAKGGRCRSQKKQTPPPRDPESRGLATEAIRQGSAPKCTFQPAHALSN